MKPQPFAAAAVALVAMGCEDGASVLQAQESERGSALFVLGDSLSDTGNAAAVADYLLGQPMYPEATIGLCHPGERLLLDRDCADIVYLRSRVSDGPVAVEHLAAYLGVQLEPSFHTVPDRPVVGTNYAVAGAKARGSTPRDLTDQVERLLADHGASLPAGAIAVLMIGGNDAIDALQAAALPALDEPGAALPDQAQGPRTDPPAGQADPARIVAEAVDGIVTAASRLLDAGACVVVANVPNLARLPAVGETAELDGLDVAAAMTAAEETATGFDSELAEGLAALAASHSAGASLVPFDLGGAFAAALEAFTAAGANVTEACFDSEGYTASALGERRFHPACEPTPGDAPEFEGFFFWDGIHPTGAAHAALGDALVQAYEAGCRGAAPAA